ncbi:hypothetical protein BDQ17DRAFT_1468365 [Cyathus striatus]|nr:hypothetical protein BDQ17DRAFT_1468365 [Cyathus striatus]
MSRNERKASQYAKLNLTYKEERRVKTKRTSQKLLVKQQLLISLLPSPTPNHNSLSTCTASLHPPPPTGAYREDLVLSLGLMSTFCTVSSGTAPVPLRDIATPTWRHQNTATKNRAGYIPEEGTGNMTHILQDGNDDIQLPSPPATQPSPPAESPQLSAQPLLHDIRNTMTIEEAGYIPEEDAVTTVYMLQDDDIQLPSPPATQLPLPTESPQSLLELPSPLATQLAAVPPRCDTVPGLTLEEVDNIFERFFQQYPSP